MHLAAGKDVFLSGIDWETEAFKALQQNTLQTIGGGHFAEVAWILVMLYDYHHGVDFWGSNAQDNSFQLTRGNIAQYLHIFGSKDWQKIDFTRFSKILSKDHKGIALSFNSIMEQFIPTVKSLSGEETGSSSFK